jgi:hypothetical protein
METEILRGTLQDDAECSVRKYAKECFERTLPLADHAAEHGSFPAGDTLAFVHDLLRAAREIAESIYGSCWETHVTEVYDRIVERADAGDVSRKRHPAPR